MLSSILRRLLLAVCTIVAGGFFSAALVRCAPGFGTDERQLDPRLSNDSIRAIQGLHAEDRNIVRSYLTSLGRTLRGDLGVSRTLNRPVRQLLHDRAAVTATVAGKGLALAWSAAVGMAFAAWFWHTPALRLSVTLFSGALLCLPAGVLALLAILLDLPAYLVIALIVYPKVHRYLSGLVEAACKMPHIITARATGATETRIFLRHVLPVIRREVLALAGVSIGIALSAAIPVEALCGVAGIGQLAWQSALARDLPLLTNVAMLVIACVVLANSGADLLSEERRQPA